MNLNLILKISLAAFFSTYTACTSRGLILSEQLPEEFIKEYKKNGFNAKRDEIIGFVEQGQEIKEENIIFLNEEQKQLYESKKSTDSTSVALVSERGRVFGKVDMNSKNKRSKIITAIKDPVFNFNFGTDKSNLTMDQAESGVVFYSDEGL